MDEQQQREPRPVNPRRRKKTPLEIFKEVYLPVIIAGVALLLILIFIIGSIVRGFQFRKLEAQAAYDASVSAQQEHDRQAAEASSLLAQAATLAAQFDYENAISVLDSFSGDYSQFPQMLEQRQTYQTQQDQLVLWDDNEAIPNLSFQLLIADPVRAFNDEDYASAYKRNFITIAEFSRVLEQLYENDYILISTDDLVAYGSSDDGAAAYFTEKPLYLPAGKKPIIITQTNVNYNLYMVDSDGDMIADKDGDGFASKLIIDANGNLANEIVHSDGTIETGAYDLVPILEAFIATHPDFSYKGARAVLALTGYNGLFGYRTHAEAQAQLDTVTYEQQVKDAKAVAYALQEAGYKLACYSYENKDYSAMNSAQIEADMSGWTAEVMPILGQIDTFVFARETDIADKIDVYESASYRVLQNIGFSYYMGYCEDGKPWISVNDNYIRQGRIVVSAQNLTNHADWFSGILDPAAVLVETR